MPVESHKPLTGLGLSAHGRVGTSYRLERPIGHGGAGEVWSAFCERLQRSVAIKAIRATHLGKAALREAQVTARLQHPAIVRVYEVIEETTGGQQLVLIVLELLDGESLAERVARLGPMDTQLAVEIMLPVLDALDYAHAEGVMHRDVKPENLMWLHQAAYGPRLRLLDFGIALAAADWRDVSRIQGTPDYMAPEQVNGGALLPAVDQWGAAATLFHLITGDVPFEACDTEAIFEKILTAPLPFPRERPIPGSLFGLLARATRKDPAERFPSMGDLRDALQAFVGTTAARAPGSDLRYSATFRREAEDPSQRPTQEAKRPTPAGGPSTLDDAIRLSFGTGKAKNKS